MHAVVFGYVFDTRRQVGAAEAGIGGFEVGLGLVQEPIAAEPEPIEEPPVLEEKPEETRVEPEPVSTPTRVAQTFPEITEHEASTTPDRLSLEVRQSDPTVTPQEVAPIGRGQNPTYGGTPGIQNLYIARLAARLNRFKYYPIRSLRRGDEGVTVLALVINRRGRVLDASIVESSGFDELDRAALRIVESAKPLPRFNRRMTMTQIRARIPIAFEVSN